jgi:hypothetical protein
VGITVVEPTYSCGQLAPLTPSLQTEGDDTGEVCVCMNSAGNLDFAATYAATNRIKVLQSAADQLADSTAATRWKSRRIVDCRRKLKTRVKRGNLAKNHKYEEPIFGPNINEDSTFR